jgi:hypothetical protein
MCARLSRATIERSHHPTEESPMLSPDHHTRMALVADRHVELRRRAQAARLRRLGRCLRETPRAAPRRPRWAFLRRPAHAA